MDQNVLTVIEECDATLAELLDRVARGETVTVARNGRPVGRIGPIPEHQPSDDDAVARLRERIRAESGAFTADEILSSIREGRTV